MMAKPDAVQMARRSVPSRSSWLAPSLVRTINEPMSEAIKPTPATKNGKVAQPALTPFTPTAIAEAATMEPT